MENIENEFNYALEGRKIWILIKEKYNFSNQCGLVIFPSDNQTLNIEAVKLLPDYKKRNLLDKLVVITSQKVIIDSLKQLHDKSIYYELIDKKNIDLLLKYYCLVPFWIHIVVISLDEPFGNSILLNKYDIDYKNYILSAIYRTG